MAANICYVDFQPDDITMPGTLRYCVDQVNQGLADEINIRAFQWYEPATELVFERSARVVGPGRVVLPGDGFPDDSLFVVGTPCPGPNCAGQAVVEIVGLQMGAVGMTGVRGIEVLKHHELTLTGVLISDFAPNGSGGGVWAGQQSTLTVTNSLIHGCSANSGGAVYSEAANTTITGSRFEDNHVSHNGGAVRIGNNGAFGRNLFVSGSEFENNTAQDGGALHTAGGQIAADIFESQFSSNAASQYGGAVFGHGSLNLSTFENNTAQLSGGGVYANGHTSIIDSTLWENSSTIGGGAAFVPTGARALTVEGSTFAFNVAKGTDLVLGAGLAVMGDSAEIVNSTFSHNEVHSAVQLGKGGGISVHNLAQVVLMHTTIADESADLGGGIYTELGTDLTMLSSLVAYSSTSDCLIDGNLNSDSSLDTDGTCGVTMAGMDPGLDGLTDNGGPTWTREIQGDGIDSAACYCDDDQRDQPRDQGICEPGAFEQ